MKLIKILQYSNSMIRVENSIVSQNMNVLNPIWYVIRLNRNSGIFNYVYQSYYSKINHYQEKYDNNT